MQRSFFSHAGIRVFVVRFFLIFAGVELLLILFPPLGYQQWIATQVGNLLHVQVNETFLLTNGLPFEISAFCSGFTTFALFAGLVAGFTAPSVEKKIGLLFSGAISIFILNFVRILFVVWVGMEYSSTAAEWVHILSWFVLSALVTGLWFVLLKHETGARNQRELAHYLLGKY